ncbi:hypothetical protein NQ315_006824 [Exocentrus adspersus]|uniref:Uncharacterized protein n=1 Tax=Exocentrus adspersus TaxID=1586481 RepID=A0AAV8WBP5_9CUCU|nr:hypothetical protein NQ315_006824 [Exocentrus adspersus]
MALELVLLCALIFIFIVSFCGLLQKIKQSYDRERMIADRLARRQAADRNSGESFSEVYVNSAYQSELRGSGNESGVFPSAPPPYSQNYADPPPKYEDVIKTEDIDGPDTGPVTRSDPPAASELPRVHSSPPPYTIST